MSYSPSTGTYRSRIGGGRQPGTSRKAQVASGLGVDDLALPDRDPKPQRRVEPGFVLNGCIVAHRILPLFCQMPIAAELFPFLCTPLTAPWTQDGARNGRPAAIPGDREGPLWAGGAGLHWVSGYGAG